MHQSRHLPHKWFSKFGTLIVGTDVNITLFDWIFEESTVCAWIYGQWTQRNNEYYLQPFLLLRFSLEESNVLIAEQHRPQQTYQQERFLHFLAIHKLLQNNGSTPPSTIKVWFITPCAVWPQRMDQIRQTGRILDIISRLFICFISILPLRAIWWMAHPMLIKPSLLFIKMCF